MDDELLIALVRSHPAFYDVSDPGYNDMVYKQKVWRHIASELNADVPTCKARWNNIRDNYRKSLKKNATRCAQAKKTKLYKYADQLSFIVEFFEDRADKGMAEISKEEEEEAEYIDEDQVVEEEVEIKPEIAESLTEFNAPFQYQAISSVIPEVKLGKRKLGRNFSYSEIPIAKRPVEYRFDDQGIHSPHPVDAFLAGIAPTLKTFSPYYLNLAKSEIFAAVQKYEMRMLEQHLAYGKPSSSYVQDAALTPSTSRSDSTSSPKESYL